MELSESILNFSLAVHFYSRLLTTIHSSFWQCPDQRSLALTDTIAVTTGHWSKED